MSQDTIDYTLDYTSTLQSRFIVTLPMKPHIAFLSARTNHPILSNDVICLQLQQHLFTVSIFFVLQQQQQCPPRADISPCSCTVKKNGLDILCEFTDQQHISNAMGVLKGKSLVIFYLKLRHNNLPKLPGFVFLGLDIRHLTIHNSSLSVMQEEALSSIGKGIINVASTKIQSQVIKFSL